MRRVMGWPWLSWHGRCGWQASILALALGALVAGCGGTATGSGSTNAHTGGSPAACVADSTTINSIATRSFCGSATAQVVVAGESITWQHGDCDTSGGNFAVNFGRAILGSGPAADALKQEFDHFGLTVMGATQDGIYTQNAVVAMDYHGDEYALVNYTVTLTNNEAQGTFGGTDSASNQPMSGTFSCR